MCIGLLEFWALILKLYEVYHFCKDKQFYPCSQRKKRLCVRFLQISYVYMGLSESPLSCLSCVIGEKCLL